MIKPNEIRYRLEFNEERQTFHLELLNTTNTHEENTFGWKTIYKSGEENFLTIFIEYVEWRYRDRLMTKNLLNREMKAYKFILGRTSQKNVTTNVEAHQ